MENCSFAYAASPVVKLNYDDDKLHNFNDT